MYVCMYVCMYIDIYVFVSVASPRFSPWSAAFASVAPFRKAP